jgi:hypothetical protein
MIKSTELVEARQCYFISVFLKVIREMKIILKVMKKYKSKCWTLNLAIYVLMYASDNDRNPATWQGLQTTSILKWKSKIHWEATWKQYYFTKMKLLITWNNKCLYSVVSCPHVIWLGSVPIVLGTVGYLPSLSMLPSAWHILCISCIALPCLAIQVFPAPALLLQLPCIILSQVLHLQVLKWIIEALLPFYVKTVS